MILEIMITIRNCTLLKEWGSRLTFLRNILLFYLFLYNLGENLPLLKGFNQKVIVELH